jgi:hypothetical protein
VVYRHHGAVLTSYRRMGWTARIDEVRALRGEDPAGPGEDDDVSAVVGLWTHLYDAVVDYAARLPRCIVVSHAELAAGGHEAMAALRAEVGLAPVAARGPAGVVTASAADDDHRLHRFVRSAEEVAHGWRERVTPDEVQRIDEAAAATWAALEELRVRVLP